MKNFVMIYNNDGNITFNLNQIVMIETRDQKAYAALIITTTTGTNTLSWKSEDFGEDAHGLRDNAYEALTGQKLDD